MTTESIPDPQDATPLREWDLPVVVDLWRRTGEDIETETFTGTLIGDIPEEDLLLIEWNGERHWFRRREVTLTQSGRGLTLDQAREHVGATVLYHPYPGAEEPGVIAHVTEHYVFVRYGVREAREAALATEAHVLTFDLTALGRLAQK